MNSIYSNILPRFIAGTAALSAIVMSQPTSVMAQTPEAAEYARSVTIQIHNPKGHGSGVILAKKGNLCTAGTAGHVVESKDVSYQVRTNDGKLQNVTRIERFTQTKDHPDVALVEFRCPNPLKVATLGNSDRLPIFSNIYVAGYPTFLGFTFTNGKITSSPLNDGSILVHNADTEGGSSGSPVFNENREVVGIHIASKIYEGQPTGFKYAVSSNTLMNLLSQTSTWLSLSDLPGNLPSVVRKPSSLGLQQQTDSTSLPDQKVPVERKVGGSRVTQLLVMQKAL